MSSVFRDLLRKIGSGPHTGKDLTRSEAEAATRMMLLQEATPAQIGAFMIAHRIKRPTGAELAGMLDAYDALGPKIQPGNFSHPVSVLGSPYDGRDRTFALSPLTALVLASAGCPVILHGGDRMPTKEGAPLVQFWQYLGVDWTKLSLAQVQAVFNHTGLGFIYLPNHFPLAQGLVTYREQIGKRPPFATVELLWSPYAGQSQVFAGFVHPPTETFMRDAMSLRGSTHCTRLITIKGLEGSCDLPRERTAIIGLTGIEHPFERLHLHPQEYGFSSKNVGLEGLEQRGAMMDSVLNNQPSDLRDSLLWNSGFYLWQCGAAIDLRDGISRATTLLQEGKVEQKLTQLISSINQR